MGVGRGKGGRGGPQKREERETERDRQGERERVLWRDLRKFCATQTIYLFCLTVAVARGSTPKGW